MRKAFINEDLRVYVVAARKGNFAAAAEELGMSASYVTKRIRVLEAELGAKLFIRTTRRVTVTSEGERAFEAATRILDEIDHLVGELSATRQTPRGSLRICSSFGFGRNIVAPAISALVERHPEIQVRFEVFDRIVDIGAERFDLDVRIGDEIAKHLIARRLATNYRVLCASPSYVKRRGMPRSLAELSNHDCLIIKEIDHPFGIWKLTAKPKEYTVKVTGPLSSNNGEIVVGWAVDGRGIMLRSMWDVRSLLQQGKLVHVLPDFRQEANVWAVYPSRLESSAKVRLCVDWLRQSLKGLNNQRD